MKHCNTRMLEMDFIIRRPMKMVWGIAKDQVRSTGKWGAFPVTIKGCFAKP